MQSFVPVPIFNTGFVFDFCLSMQVRQLRLGGTSCDKGEGGGSRFLWDVSLLPFFMFMISDHLTIISPCSQRTFKLLDTARKTLLSLPLLPIHPLFTMVQPRGAELDDACASDESIGFVLLISLILKKSSTSFSNLQTLASPTQLSHLWVCAPYRHFSCTSKLQERRERSLMMERMRGISEGILYCHIFVRCVTGIRRVIVSVQYIKMKV